jgi:hypothetical protein
MSRNTLLKNCCIGFFVSFSLLSVNTKSSVGREFRGEFTLSCRNIEYTHSFFGPSLKACCAPNCQTTSIDLSKHITNDRGTLKWVERGGDYHISCARAQNIPPLDSNGQRTILTLSCETGRGDERRITSVDLDEHIANRNGRLVYISLYIPSPRGEF